MKNKRFNFRDCQAWKNENLTLSTSSNECCKLYDAALTQYVGWYDDDSFGGLDKTMESLNSADPNFVLGKALSVGLNLMGAGCTVRTNSTFAVEVEEMLNLAKLQENILSEREKKHVEAVKLFSEGQMSKASLIWEDITVDHPTDMLAIKFAHDNYFNSGKQAEMRDGIARVLPSWNKGIPLYSYLYGMYAFGLNETNYHDRAELNAKKALDMNCNDAWATHALAHVYEMKGCQDEGIVFMSKTINDWQSCQMLSCHNFWHWALYHIEKGEYDAAFDLFDERIAKIADENQGALLDIVDASSLLFRLELEGQNPGKERWQNVLKLAIPHSNEHIILFNDAHLLMAYLGANDKNSSDKFMASLREYTSQCNDDTSGLNREFGINVMDGLIAYKDKRYCDAVELLLPSRYQFVKAGGSNAQRDVFNQILIHAALNSNTVKNTKLARQLLTERKAEKQNSPLTDRLISKAISKHQNES